MAADPDVLGSAKLLSVPELIGIQKEAPSQHVYEDRAVFIPTTDEGEGFNVPKPLIDYIEHHGGLEISGLPITRFQKYGDGFRQCFQYLCLTHQPDAVAWLQTQPEALGYFYERLHPECKKSKIFARGEANPGEFGAKITEVKIENLGGIPVFEPWIYSNHLCFVERSIEPTIIGLRGQFGR